MSHIHRALANAAFLHRRRCNGSGLLDGHLARFVVAVVEPLDLSAMTRRYAGRGHNAHHPAVLLSLLVYVMPVTGKGFDQCYNAQAVVDTDTLLVTHVHVTQATNDKQQVAPQLTAWQGYPEVLGQRKRSSNYIYRN